MTKILGSSLNKSEVVPGMVFKKSVESNIIKVENAKIAVFTCPVDATSTETKGTVLIKTAAELTDFSRGEENLLVSIILNSVKSHPTNKNCTLGSRYPVWPDNETPKSSSLSGLNCRIIRILFRFSLLGNIDRKAYEVVDKYLLLNIRLSRYIYHSLSLKL